jgi:hypothetical protein
MEGALLKIGGQLAENQSATLANAACAEKKRTETQAPFPSGITTCKPRNAVISKTCFEAIEIHSGFPIGVFVAFATDSALVF